MSNTKSPFMCLDNLLSPLQTQQIVDSINVYQPEQDENGAIKPLYLQEDDIFVQIIDRLTPILNQICEYYGSEFKGIDSMTLEWVPSGANIATHSENSVIVANKWLKTQNRDLTGVIFLNSHIDPKQIQEMDDYECCGGKLQFVNYGFGFLPQAGDLIIYPSDARFANSTANVLAGDLFQVRFHIVTTRPYIHDINKFPGTYRDWF